MKYNTPSPRNPIANIVTRIMPRVISDKRRDDEIARLNKDAMLAELSKADIEALND